MLLYLATRKSFREVARFQVSHLLWGTLVVAIMVVTYKVNKQPAYAMAIEWGLLSVVCIASARRASKQHGGQRWLWSVVALTTFAGIVTLALFYQHCVKTIEPLA